MGRWRPLSWFLGTRLGRWLTAAVALVSAFLMAFLMGRREGRNRAEQYMQRRDVERSNEIEKDVDQRLRDLEGDTRPVDDRLRDLGGLRPDREDDMP